MNKRLPGLAALFATALLLTGCGGGAPLGGLFGGGVEDERYVGLPEEYEVGDGMPSEQPLVTWLQPGETFAVVTWGSSSCPAEASAIEAPDAASVVVTFASSGGSGPCTADMAPTTHEFTLPPEATERPLGVVIRFEDYEQETAITLE